jgi:hypothetical protein
MGLLDDAIREHLDLKRRRGADPAEVERAEREALGPVRRAPEGQPSPDPDSEAGAAYDHEAQDEESWSHDAHDDLPDVTDERDAPAEPAEYEQPLALDDEPEFDSEPGLATTDDEHRATPPPHPAGDHETAEYDVEEAIEAEHKPGDEDVLEETPEFLQDTPDHDRLWFEQRPPKDFDFDG